MRTNENVIQLSGVGLLCPHLFCEVDKHVLASVLVFETTPIQVSKNSPDDFSLDREMFSGAVARV